jgi:hypothetical protein
MKAKTELIMALRERYKIASRPEKAQILDEFVAVSGYHRKHAIRRLKEVEEPSRVKLARNKVYDTAVTEALRIMWEAADRLCGKRLKVALPSLLYAMERDGHIALDSIVKEKLLAMSAATIDRSLRLTRQHIDGKGRRRPGIGSAIRRSIPVRTFADWGDPQPGFFEIDMVEHCGGIKRGGNFVHTLTLTDIATGWTECVSMPVRDQSLIVEALKKASSDLLFPMLGVDTDNDSAFMNQAVFDFCRERNLKQTRSRAYKKNDQAWVEQKNGAIVRRLVGYGRLSGLEATQTLARLYASSRLYINFFQPSFKLKEKKRDGARVSKKYHPPLTPYDRILLHASVSEEIKTKLRVQFASLDPVRLLHDMRTSQQQLATLANIVSEDQSIVSDVATFLKNLSHAWKDGENRPTHRGKSGTERDWKTRSDPFEDAWPLVEEWLAEDPGITAKAILARLASRIPDVYVGESQLRTLQRRVKTWRAARARDLIFASADVTDSLARLAERNKIAV